MPISSRAKIHRCTRYPSRTVYQVTKHIVGSKDSVYIHTACFSEADFCIFGALVQDGSQIAMPQRSKSNLPQRATLQLWIELPLRTSPLCLEPTAQPARCCPRQAPSGIARGSRARRQRIHRLGHTAGRGDPPSKHASPYSEKFDRDFRRFIKTLADRYESSTQLCMYNIGEYAGSWLQGRCSDVHYQPMTVFS